MTSLPPNSASSFLLVAFLSIVARRTDPTRLLPSFAHFGGGGTLIRGLIAGATITADVIFGADRLDGVAQRLPPMLGSSNSPPLQPVSASAMATLLAKLMNGCSVSSNAVLSRSGNGGAMLSRFSVWP